MGRTGYRVIVWSLIVLTGGLVFQAGNCVAFALDSTMAATNICYIIDCQNGLFGGLINPCGSPFTSADDLLQDCPAPISLSGTGTTPTTTTTTP